MTINIFCERCATKKTSDHTYCQKCGALFNPNILKYDQIPVERLTLLLGKDAIPDNDIPLVQKLISLADGTSVRKEFDKSLFWNYFYIIAVLVHLPIFLGGRDYGLGGLIFYLSSFIISIMYSVHYFISIFDNRKSFIEIEKLKKWHLAITLHLPALGIIPFIALVIQIFND